MKYIHFEVDAKADDVVEVSLDRAANVQLLDPVNYEEYKSGRPFDYHGGYATTTPVQLTVPIAGQWHVVIDLGGGPGHVKASMQLLSGSGV